MQTILVLATLILIDVTQEFCVAVLDIMQQAISSTSSRCFQIVQNILEPPDFLHLPMNYLDYFLQRYFQSCILEQEYKHPVKRKYIYLYFYILQLQFLERYISSLNVLVEMAMNGMLQSIQSFRYTQTKKCLLKYTQIPDGLLPLQNLQKLGIIKPLLWSSIAIL